MIEGFITIRGADFTEVIGLTGKDLVCEGCEAEVDEVYETADSVMLCRDCFEMNESEGEKPMFANIWTHPRTSIAGALIFVVTAGGVLSQQGITLGHAGTGTVVALAGSLATAFLGLLAKDPGAPTQAR